MRKQRAEQHERAIDSLIEKGQAGNHLKMLVQRGRRRQIPAARDATGLLHSNRSEIAEVFAKFYEALYTPDDQRSAH
eukprot:9459500-Karenia_brevis.AAC.1